MAEKRVKKAGISCPVTFALEIFGDRWTLLILRSLLLDGHHSYKDLLGANQGLATNVLADRLKRLESRGLVTKTRDPADARQFVYKPTSLGVSVIPMLVEMMIWGSTHGQGRVSKSFRQRFERDRQALIDELKLKASRDAGLA